MEATDSMIDERFTAAAFRALGRGTPEASRLADALREAIAEECVPELRAAGARVASRLRALGHDVAETALEHYGGAFGITYVDASVGPEREHHLLRFNLDLTVSSGYPGYRSRDDGDGEQ